MPTLIGTYVFAPTIGPGENRTRRDGTTTHWWLILKCDRSMCRYQSRLLHFAEPGDSGISEPLWGSHVSIIRGEEPPNKALWNSMEGKQVSIEYEQSPQEIHGYVFLPVTCEPALDYRQDLGLPREPEIPLHLTIGNRKQSTVNS